MIALVTGGGRGIGRAIALALAKNGWAVAIAARSAQELDETVKLSEGRMLAVPADVADPASVKALVSRVQQELGPVTLLVNNAGAGGPLSPFCENDPEEWWRCQEVNLRGPMLLCREIVPGMLARRSGRIINIVSGAAVQSFPDMSAYVVSKTALLRFSEQLALELKPHGVSVFPVRPGVVRTRMFEESRARLAFLQQMVDRGLAITPDVVAGLVLKLASGCADALSGRFFSVDEDADEMIRRADEIVASERYLLRAQKL
ncbi:MAG: SDR family oxidoreductase [Acidobacteriia bacterium]|nr:SDR family oxidoreductase [Terriglobia bacterium]